MSDREVAEGLSNEALDYFGAFMQMEEQEGNEPQNYDLICAICLDIFYRPTTLYPCGHIFCDPCLRRLSNAQIVRCPICRTRIMRCLFNRDLTRTVIRQYGWTSYSQRSTDEWSTGIFQVVLPPVRRTLSEIVDEWIEDWLTQDRQLFMFLLMFLRQTFIILGVNLIFRYESAVETIHQRLRPIMRVVMVLRLIWRLIKMIVLSNLSRLQRAIFPEVDNAGQLP